MRLSLFLVLSVLGAAAWLGCNPPENYTTLVPTDLEGINAIRNNASLTSQEKRTKLEDLGLSPTTINALLRTERTGNQFGGDLRSAYLKVVEPNFLALTPDEIQIYADEASAADTSVSVTWDDVTAQAIATFFAENRLSSAAALEAYLADPANAVPTEIDVEDLEDVFITFDPSLLLTRLP